MPRDPVNDVFNEMVDLAIDTLLDTMQPGFRKLAKEVVANAQRQAKQQSPPRSNPSGFKRGKERDQRTSSSPPPTRRPVTTLYDTLEVSHRASQETIEAAYKSLARKHHPDVGGSTAKMQEITSAYSVLKDKESRKRYDKEIGL